MNIKEIPTPAYVIDEKKLRENLQILKDIEDKSGARILLAQKAYSAYQTYPLVAQYLAGATASGLYEARLAHEEFKAKGIESENHVYEPAFKDDEMEELCNICDHIVFNSISQLEHHRSVWEKAVSEKRLSVGLRINPEYSSDDSFEIYDPCSSGSRLGIRNQDMPQTLPEGVEGLHFHNLCEQGFEPLEETFLKVEKDFHRFFPQPRIDEDYDGYVYKALGYDEEEFDDTGESIDDLEALDGAAGSVEIPSGVDEEYTITNTGSRIKWINLGGGHHITREGYDRDGLVKLISYIKEKYGLDVYLEPGEAIALEAGYLVTTIMDVGRRYRPLISRLLYPSILVMEMDWAFFSMMILDKR